MLVTTPSNVIALVTTNKSVDQYMALLCDEVTVNLKVAATERDSVIYYTTCRSCPYLQNRTCLGGAYVMDKGDCQRGITPPPKTIYVRKVIPPHVVVLSYSYYKVFYVESEIERTKNLILKPLLIGNIEEDGAFCFGSVDYTFHDFADCYYKIFAATRNGDYNYLTNTVEHLVKEWSIEFQKENWDEDDAAQYTTTLLTQLDVSKYSDLTIHPPGTYDILSTRRSSEVEDLPEHYIRLHSRIVGKLWTEETRV